MERDAILEIDKLRIRALLKEISADNLVGVSIKGLVNRDKNTEKLVSQLNQAKEKHVSSRILVHVNAQQESLTDDLGVP